MSSLVRRIQRRIKAKINDATPENERYRITRRRNNPPSKRQAGRGIKKGNLS